MEVEIRLGPRTPILSRWYSIAVESPDIEASPLARAAIRAHMAGAELWIGSINPKDAYEPKLFRLKLNDQLDADIIRYLEEKNSQGKPAKTVIKAILTRMIKVTSGESSIPAYSDIIPSGFLYSKDLTDTSTALNDVARVTVPKNIPDEPEHEVRGTWEREENFEEASKNIRSTFAGFGLR